RTPRSRELHERARRVYPQEVTYAIRYLDPYPVYISRGMGPIVWDVDGNSYVDYWMGHGAHFLGHRHPEVMEAIRGQLEYGVHFGFEHELAVEYAELLTNLLPNVEMLRFTNSGTEASHYAIRLARAYTGKNVVVKIKGGWHGGVEQLHYDVTYPYGGFESAGIPSDLEKYIRAVPFNDLDAMEEALKKRDVAAVIMEPVLGGTAIPPRPGYLRGVRELVEKYDALLIFDEVVTGFRLALGGGQEAFGVSADIVIHGKIIGGGLPIGVFGGSSEVMKLIDTRLPRNERAYHGGTFSANPLSMAAGMAAVKFLMNHRSIYDEVNSNGEFLRRELAKVCEENDVPIHVTGVSSMIGIHFTREKPRNHGEAYEFRWLDGVEKLFVMYMRAKGNLMLSEKSIHPLLSAVHGRDHLEKFIKDFRNFIEFLTN
ncbi:MAG: aspartate aminotransferase family protein, partial [Nitrososphaerota archaeon]|nr:aspartate aminotransferase family protein [Nitrososphaerota archaeon]